MFTDAQLALVIRSEADVQAFWAICLVVQTTAPVISARMVTAVTDTGKQD